MPDIADEIIDAVGNNDAEGLRNLIAKGADVNATYNDGKMTLLGTAARDGHFEIARLLIHNGADVNPKTRSYTPLELAVSNGNEDIVSLLIQEGADIHCCDKGSWPLLHIAAAGGHKNIAKILIEKGAKLNAKNSENGNTPLYCAALNGKIETVRLLAESGADLNVTDNDGLTALTMAVRNQREDVAWLLIEMGADIKAGAFGGGSLLSQAALFGYSRVVQKLIGIDKSIVKDSDALHSAVKRGHVALAGFLIEQGADVKARAYDSRVTVLHCAAEDGNTAMVLLLLDKGADLNARSNSGWTPLHYATRDRKAAVVRLLIERGADLNMADDRGSIPLGLAADLGNAEIVHLLIQGGADVHAADNIGKTPYQLAKTPDIRKLIRKASGGNWLTRLLGLAGCHRTKTRRLDNFAPPVSLDSEGSPEVVVDKDSRLMWQRNHAEDRMTHADALSYCESLNLDNHTDWSLPTLSQFRKCSDAVRTRLSRAGDVFWTNSNFEHRPETQAYASDGTSFNKAEEFYVRAVRRM